MKEEKENKAKEFDGKNDNLLLMVKEIFSRSDKMSPDELRAEFHQLTFLITSCVSIRCDVLQDSCQCLAHLIDISDAEMLPRISDDFTTLINYLDLIRPMYCVGINTTVEDFTNFLKYNLKEMKKTNKQSSKYYYIVGILIPIITSMFYYFYYNNQIEYALPFIIIGVPIVMYLGMSKMLKSQTTVNLVPSCGTCYCATIKNNKNFDDYINKSIKVIDSIIMSIKMNEITHEYETDELVPPNLISMVEELIKSLELKDKEKYKDVIAKYKEHLEYLQENIE